MREQFSTLDKVHHEMDALFILEHIDHLDQEGMFTFEEDVFLQFDTLKAVVLQNSIFTNTLHGI